MQRTLINRKEIENVGNFGVELELVNVDKVTLIKALQLKHISAYDAGYSHTINGRWKIVSDASIQGNGGCELVSPILNGQAGLKQLREVCLTLYFINAKVNDSCGLHVHHQAPNDLTDQHKTNLMKFYARLERTIDAFMPANRKRMNNRFCKSMVDAYWRLNTYTQLQHLGRYYKLNFQSLSRYGTIEFRQHGGTIEFEKIYHWICFTANFLHNCKGKRSVSRMNYIERAWTPKHLKLSKRCWKFFKSRMIKLDDLDRSLQNVRADNVSLVAIERVSPLQEHEAELTELDTEITELTEPMSFQTARWSMAQLPQL